MLPSSWMANFLLPFKKTSALADFKFVAQDGIYPIKFLLLFLVQVLQKKIFKIKRADIVCRLWWMLKKHKCHEDQKMFFLLQPSMENIPEAKVSTDCTCALHHCTTPGGNSRVGGEMNRAPQSCATWQPCLYSSWKTKGSVWAWCNCRWETPRLITLQPWAWLGDHFHLDQHPLMF